MLLEGSDCAHGRAARWPYLVGLGSLSVAALGLVFAPISGVVYVALPGLVLASVWAFACRCPARVGLAVSTAAFSAGIAAFLVGVLGLASDAYFFSQEWGFVAGLYGFPIIGLLVGFPSLALAWRLPGDHRLPLLGTGPKE